MQDEDDIRAEWRWQPSDFVFRSLRGLMYICMYVYVPLWEGLTEEIKRFLKDPEWAAEASTAPGELTNKAHCCGITARVCFVQPLEAGGELTQTRCNAA